MKVYFSVDMEGIGCIVHPSQVIPPRMGSKSGFATDVMAYERGKRLLTGEVKAAVEGAYQAGATEVVVCEGHGSMDNIIVEELDPRVRVMAGTPKPMCQATGLDSSYAAVILLGYHAPWKTPLGVMGHNFTGVIKVNGQELGEAGMTAAVAGCYGVPVVMVTGDRATTEHAARLLGQEIIQVPVKEGLGYMSANCLHPVEAQARIRAGVIESLGKNPKPKPFVVKPPITLEMEFNLVLTSELACLIPGVESLGGARVRYVGDDYLQVYDIMRLFLNLANVGLAA